MNCKVEDNKRYTGRYRIEEQEQYGRMMTSSSSVGFFKVIHFQGRILKASKYAHDNISSIVIKYNSAVIVSPLVEVLVC
jgi:hypothetical protein